MLPRNLAGLDKGGEWMKWIFVHVQFNYKSLQDSWYQVPGNDFVIILDFNKCVTHQGNSWGLLWILLLPVQLEVQQVVGLLYRVLCLWVEPNVLQIIDLWY